MPTVTPWDVRIVNATTLASVAYIPHWENLQFTDSLNTPGHGSVEVDFDEPWLDTFYTANNNYPWEGNYAIQVLRNGALVFTGIIEEAEIEYAGTNRRRAVLGGRGIAACLEWAIVLPGGFDESQSDPDALIVIGGMNRGFGDSEGDATQAELDAGTYGVDNPKLKAFGGAAFVYLFKEADTGNAGTANTASSYAISTANRTEGVDWPLSLDTAGGGMSETKDGASTPADWSNTTSYPDLDVTWLFEIPAGQNMYQTLEHCAEITANAQWRVAPDGKILMAKSLGLDKTDSVFLTVPNATHSTNQLHRKDLRTSMFGSNGYAFEKATSDTAITDIYGRREMYLSADQAHGETVGEAAKQALKDIENTLDEFTFQYIETATTQAWLDFNVGDTVRIEYKAGTSQNRQVTGLSANISSQGEAVEITIGDVVENAIARLKQEEATEQESWQIKIPNFASSGQPVRPRSVSASTEVDGMDRAVEVAFKQSKGWENEIAQYEVEVWKV